jgi:hypothetical protein
VTVAAALAAYAVCAGVLGPRLLGQATWTERAPRLGIVTYLAAAWSVVAACGLAGLTLTVHATALGGGLSRLIGACVLRLRAEYATPGGTAVAWSGLALAAAVAAWTAVTAVTHLRAVRGQAARTAQAVRLVGRPEPELGAVLVNAVLAHERAHLACHHHRFLAIARIGRQVFPFIPLMRDAAGQVARLAEMHADDAATAGRDTRPLATALVVLASAGAAPVPETPALAAAGPDAVHRVQRLLTPAEPLGRVRRHLLRATAAGLALVPLLLALTPALVALALGRVQPA